MSIQPAELARSASVSTTVFLVEKQMMVSPEGPNSSTKTGLSQPFDAELLGFPASLVIL